MNRRRFLQLLTLSTVGLVGGVPTYAWSEAHRFGLSRHSFKLPRLERGLRVAHLSDLHFGRWHREPAIRRWVDATLAQNPDLIVLTGDLVDGRTSIERLEAFTAELARLRAPLGVFATWGNHDYGLHRGGRLEAFGQMLERVGIRVLTNQGAQIRPDLYLAGVDDYWHSGCANRWRDLVAFTQPGYFAKCSWKRRADAFWSHAWRTGSCPVRCGIAQHLEIWRTVPDGIHQRTNHGVRFKGFGHEHSSGQVVLSGGIGDARVAGVSAS
jgi:hypothetical protein